MVGGLSMSACSSARTAPVGERWRRRAKYNADAHICTTDVAAGKGICQADSGGPLFKTVDGLDYQVGINSFAESFYSPTLLCSSSGYTKVATYVEWINGIISPRPPPNPVNRRATPSNGSAALARDAASTSRISRYEAKTPQGNAHPRGC